MINTTIILRSTSRFILASEIDMLQMIDLHWKGRPLRLHVLLSNIVYTQIFFSGDVHLIVLYQILIFNNIKIMTFVSIWGLTGP